LRDWRPPELGRLACLTRPKPPESRWCSWTSGARLPPAPTAAAGCPSPRGVVSPARTAGSSATATWWGPSTSPLGMRAAETSSPCRRRSRTVEADVTFPVPAAPGVTRAGSGGTPAGSDEGPGPPWPVLPRNPRREVARVSVRCRSRIRRPQHDDHAKVGGHGTRDMLRDGRAWRSHLNRRAAGGGERRIGRAGGWWMKDGAPTDRDHFGKAHRIRNLG